MNHDRRQALRFGLFIPSAVLLEGVALAREPAKGARPKATDPLQRYLGSWQGDVTAEAVNAKPEHYTQRNVFAWTLGGTFLEERGTGSNGTSFVGLWSREKTGGYMAYYFLAPAGDVAALSQRWDEQQQSFLGSADLGGGLQMLTSDQFHGPDSYEWSITVKDGKGTTLSRMVGRERRLRR